MTRKAPPKRGKKMAGTWVPHQIDDVDVRVMKFTGDRGADGGQVPTEKPYLFLPDHLREMAWAIWPHDGTDPTPCLLVGPKGCGKTSLVNQLASRVNQRVYRTNLNVGTSVKHLKGHRGAKDGSTVFYPGVVTRAMEEGAWLLLDEISGASPHVALSLFPVLEPDGEVWLEEAEPPRYVKRHPDFRLFATDNVIGNEQEESRFQYSGTNPDQNEALLDRFHSTIQCGYPDRDTEHAIVRLNLPHLTDQSNDMVQFVIRIVELIRSDEQCAAFSTRMAIEWSRRLTAGRMNAAGEKFPLSLDQILVAANYAFLSKMRSKGDRVTMEEIIRRKLTQVRSSLEQS